MIFRRNKFRERNVWDDDDGDKKGCDRDEVLTHSMHSFISSAVSSGGRRSGRNSFCIKKTCSGSCNPAPRLFARLFSRRRTPLTDVVRQEAEYDLQNFLEVADGGQRKRCNDDFFEEIEIEDSEHESKSSKKRERKFSKPKKKRTSRLRKKTTKFNGSDSGGMSAAAKMYLCHRDSIRDDPMTQRQDLHLLLGGGAEDETTAPVEEPKVDNPPDTKPVDYDNANDDYVRERLRYGCAMSEEDPISDDFDACVVDRNNKPQETPLGRRPDAEYSEEEEDELESDEHHEIISSDADETADYEEECDTTNDVAMRARLETLRLQKELLGECHPDIALTLNNIGNIHYGRGEYGEAMKAFNEALFVSRGGGGGSTSAAQRSSVYPRELQHRIVSSPTSEEHERLAYGIESVF